MKNLSVLFLSILFSLLSYGDIRQEQKIKQLQLELTQMAPLVSACISLIKNDMATYEADCMRIIGDFNFLLRELCIAQDNLHQSNK